MIIPRFLIAMLVCLSFISPLTNARTSPLPAVMKSSDEFQSLQHSDFWGSVARGAGAVCPDTGEYTNEYSMGYNNIMEVLVADHKNDGLAFFQPISADRFRGTTQWVFTADRKVKASKGDNIRGWYPDFFIPEQEQEYIKAVVSALKNGRIPSNHYRSIRNNWADLNGNVRASFVLEKKGDPETTVQTIFEHSKSWREKLTFIDSRGTKHDLTLANVHRSFICPPSPVSPKEFPWMKQKHPEIRDKYSGNPIFVRNIDIGAIGDRDKDFGARTQVWVVTLSPAPTFVPTRDADVAL